MTEKFIAYCGLICGLCDPSGGCGCKGENHCGKRLSPEGCYQFTCCTEKEINGCWECDDSPCGKDMLAADKIKMRAFVRCIREEGMDSFLRYVEQNKKRGIVYHRSGIIGDYDLENEEQVLQLLKQPK